MCKWEKIETAPKDGTRVLVWNKLWEAPATAQFYTDFVCWKYFYAAPKLLYQPTHWMPLPKPPKEE